MNKALGSTPYAVKQSKIVEQDRMMIASMGLVQLYFLTFMLHETLLLPYFIISSLLAVEKTKSQNPEII